MREVNRVVSLLPSTTEMVCLLGAQDRLVGRSHECDFPAEVSDLPVCTAPKFDASGSSRAIDEAVRELVRDALSLYRVDEETLRSLEPDLILTQSQCDVCAVDASTVERAVADLLGTSTRIVSLASTDLPSVFRDVQTVGEALGLPQQGKDAAEALAERVRRIAEISAGVPHAERPSVACIEWLEPLMVAGNWVPEMVHAAGGEPVLVRAGEHSGFIDWGPLVEAAPDVVVLMPCGFDIPRIRQELSLLTARPEWATLPAVARDRVYVTDANQYFNRPGPRLVESTELLAEMLHPDLFQFGHRGAGWESV